MKRNRLKHWANSIVLAGLLAVFTLPLGIVVYQLVAEIDVGIHFTEREQIGLEYNAAIRTLMQQVMQHRSQVDLYLRTGSSDRLSEIQQQIQHSIEKIEALQANTSNTLRTAENWEFIKQDWQKILQDFDTQNDRESFKSHSTLIDKLLEQIAHVGDTSNMILDPELDAYHLLDTLITKLPPVIEHSAQLEKTAIHLSEQAQLNSDEKAKLLYLYSSINSRVNAIARARRTVFEFNPALQQQLYAPAKNGLNSTQEFLDIINPNSFGSISFQSSSFPAPGERAISEQFKLYDAIVPAVEQLLQNRMNSYNWRKYRALGFASLVLVAMIAIYVALTRSLLRRKEAESAVQRAEEQYRSIFENSTEGIFQTTPDGRFLSVNPSLVRIYGYDSAEDLIAQLQDVKTQLYVDTESRDRFIELMHQSDRASEFEAQVYRKDGSCIWISESAVAVRDTEGQLVSYVGTVQDISDRVRVEEERKVFAEELYEAKESAEAASRAKSQFLANMSHELRTPLNAIIGYSEMLQEDAIDFGYDEIQSDLQKIRNAGKHLLDLINDILDISKIEAGKMELFLETFAIELLIEEIEATVQPLIARNNNTLKIEKSQHLGTIHADLTKVRQVLLNLLSNATKFTKDGVITLSVQENLAAGMLEIAIADSGIGMTPEQMSRLFEAFTQADASTTRKYGGTGLGLVISKRFCQMMGGNISVTSEMDQGSTFTVQLPLHVAEAPTESNVSLPVPLPATNAAKVLVIDDDPVVQELLQRYLTKEGFHVLTASTGEEGLQLAIAHKPAAITLDVLMPKMDGWAILSAIKANPELAEIPVVVLTIVDNKNLGFALGASDYLTKPIDYKRLNQVLTKYRPNSAAVTEMGRVLVVEDDQATRELFQRALEKEGWTTTVASNGRVALLELSAAPPPDLILLDMMMPEMDGFQFIAELRTVEAWRSIPVIVVTAMTLTSAEYAQINGSVEQVLQKAAYNREELLSEVRDLVVERIRNL